MTVDFTSCVDLWLRLSGTCLYTCDILHTLRLSLWLSSRMHYEVNLRQPFVYLRVLVANNRFCLRKLAFVLASLTLRFRGTTVFKEKKLLKILASWLLLWVCGVFSYDLETLTFYFRPKYLTCFQFNSWNVSPFAGHVSALSSVFFTGSDKELIKSPVFKTRMTFL